VCCSVLQCVAVRSSVFQFVFQCFGLGFQTRRPTRCASEVFCIVLQCAAVCCSVLQCDAVCVPVFWLGIPNKVANLGCL